MHTRSYQIFLDITLYLVNYLYLLIIDMRFFPKKFWHIKQEAGYLFYTGKTIVHIIISRIICLVRWYQIFADITLNLVSYLYLLIINMSFVVNILVYKTSSWVFILHRKKFFIHTIISRINCHVSLYQIYICRYHA